MVALTNEFYLGVPKVMGRAVEGLGFRKTTKAFDEPQLALQVPYARAGRVAPRQLHTTFAHSLGWDARALALQT